jgi:hypothetical protein
VESGMLATTHCPSVTSEIFQVGSEPSEYCTMHPGPPLKGVDDGAAAVPEDVRDTEVMTTAPAARPSPPAPAPAVSKPVKRP